MTHREQSNGFEFEAQTDSSSPNGFQEVLELLVDHGFEGMAQAMQTLLNEAMKLERSQVLGARPYERTLTAARKEDYNQHRPHSSLGYLTPAQFAARCAAESFAALNPRSHSRQTQEQTLIATGT